VNIGEYSFFCGNGSEVGNKPSSPRSENRPNHRAHRPYIKSRCSNNGDRPNRMSYRTAALHEKTTCEETEQRIRINRRRHRCNARREMKRLP